MPYEAVIGMEVHAQVQTASKMFCGCSAQYAAAPPNTHVCPVCLAMPGVLPVINAAAVEATVRTGLALQCEIPEFTKFDRKNYSYPDLPKGYQISQYDRPLCRDGYLHVVGTAGARRIRIRRVHLEEDTGKLIHEGSVSLIDFNRAGVPLMEIVTESDLRSADEAWQYLVKLRGILRTLGVSSGDMEKGAMRCEANVSIREVGSQAYGTKVEVKNLNSFRSVRLAIAYEVERQAAVLDEGRRVEQVTMGWDERNLCTVFQRSKEEAHDYRYFPEPDLPPLYPSQTWTETLRRALPELPEARAQRIERELGIRGEDAVLLTEERGVADWYEKAAALAPAGAGPQLVANWVLGQVYGLLREHGGDLATSRLTPAHLAELLGMVQQGTINQTVAKEVLAEAFVAGTAPAEIVRRRGLVQISNEEALAGIVERVLASNAQAVADYRQGKRAALGYLIGQVMRATRGQANATIVERLLRTALSPSDSESR